MVKEDVMLNNKTGLHARPATEIAKTAMSYKSDITFLVNDKNTPTIRAASSAPILIPI